MNAPDWMMAMLGQGIPSDAREQAEALRVRELAMPADLRASGRKRQLRDAYLTWMLLDDRLTPRDGNAWQVLERIRTRSNARAQAKIEADELAVQLSVADIEWCSQAARDLYRFVVEHRVGRQ